MLYQNGQGSSSRASSAVPRGAHADSETHLEKTISDKGPRAHSRQHGRVSSAGRLSQAADLAKEEEQDKAKIEQLKVSSLYSRCFVCDLIIFESLQRQIEMNNSEILENWDQIAIIKRNIF